MYAKRIGSISVSVTFDVELADDGTFGLFEDGICVGKADTLAELLKDASGFVHGIEEGAFDVVKDRQLDIAIIEHKLV
jgi:hypothetical protein